MVFYLYISFSIRRSIQRTDLLVTVSHKTALVSVFYLIGVKPQKIKSVKAVAASETIQELKADIP